jgi:hypothetical protein
MALGETFTISGSHPDPEPPDERSPLLLLATVPAFSSPPVRVQSLRLPAATPTRLPPPEDRNRPESAQAVRDSRKKWRDTHPDYQKNYWQPHPEATQSNRERQRQRDQKRRIQRLIKNISALDLKHSPTQVWQVGACRPGSCKEQLSSLASLDLSASGGPPGGQGSLLKRTSLWCSRWCLPYKGVHAKCRAH